MARYAVRVIEKLAKTVIVENANTLEEAISAVECSVNKDHLLLDFDDFDEREIRPSEYFKSGIVPDEEDVSFYTHIDVNETLKPYEEY